MLYCLCFTVYAFVPVVLLSSHVLRSGVLYVGFCLVAVSLPHYLDSEAALEREKPEL
jgi:hypothetical protein